MNAPDFKHIPRIVVIDDEPLNLEIIEDYLDDYNYETVYYTSADQAWEQLKSSESPVDVILLDRMMPGTDGLTLLKWIRKDDHLKNIPVILQTAMIREEDVVEGMKAGAYYYLTKPFSEDMLKSVLQTALKDRLQFLYLQHQLKQQQKIPNLLRKAEFIFQSLEDVNVLSLLIANACPNSEVVVSGLAEIMINAVEHGNLGISYQEKSELIKQSRWKEEINHRLTLPEYRDLSAKLHFERHEDKIIICISDHGDGFKWEQFLDFDPGRILDAHGRGIAMAKKFSFSEVHYNEKGNHVELTLNLAP